MTAPLPDALAGGSAPASCDRQAAEALDRAPDLDVIDSADDASASGAKIHGRVDWSVNWERQSGLPPHTSTVVLQLADRCLEISDQMDNFDGGRKSASLLAKPGFVALVREFAKRFELLVGAVDTLQVEGLPWRHLIADARLLKALEAGQAAYEKHVRDQATVEFLKRS